MNDFNGLMKTLEGGSNVADTTGLAPNTATAATAAASDASNITNGTK